VAVVRRINVVYLYVRAVERSAALYRDALGIPLAPDPADPDWAEATLDGVRFALHAAHGETDLGSGTLRVDLEVDDIEVAAERLRAAGVEVGEVERESWGAACEFGDPDGYRLHLFQPPG
jgi:catechol 2,3-dioxygenase-like lactoylglutathione lyase family enzyme